MWIWYWYIPSPYDISLFTLQFFSGIIHWLFSVHLSCCCKWLPFSDPSILLNWQSALSLEKYVPKISLAFLSLLLIGTFWNDDFNILPPGSTTHLRLRRHSTFSQWQANEIDLASYGFFVRHQEGSFSPHWESSFHLIWYRSR